MKPKVKSILVLFILTLFISSISYAQDVVEIELLEETKKFDDLEFKKKSDHSFKAIFGKKSRLISKGKLSSKKVLELIENQKFKFSVIGKTLDLTVREVSSKNPNRRALSSENKNRTEFLNVAINNGKTVGSMMLDGRLYKLRPESGTGNTLVIEVPSDALSDHGDDYVENIDMLDTSHLDGHDSSANPSGSSASNGHEITVIVAYTQGFYDAAGDINGYIDLLELETNTALANSGVNAHVNIVYSYLTSYRDTGDFYLDRSYFRNSNNTYSQQLRQLRNSRNADIMMVLTGPDYDFCGIANQIGSNVDTAFAFASENCATGYFSFAHEIGHLMGARHIKSQDPSSTPYAYGHGYCNSYKWRTVMAYNCPQSGGPRIQQWSNPGVFVNGEISGSADLEDNARVWDVRAYTVSNYKTGGPNDALKGHGTTSSVWIKDKWGYKQRIWGESYYADVQATVDQYCDYLGFTHATSYTANSCGEDEDDYMRFNPSTFKWESKDSGSKNRCYKLVSSVSCQH